MYDDPYWVEVKGFPGYTGTSYDSRAAALGAAAKGIKFWSCYQKGHDFNKVFPEWFEANYPGIWGGYSGSYKWNGSDPGIFY